MTANRRVLLSSRPTAVAQASDFTIVEAAVEAPEEGEILVRNTVLSVEPAMRGWTLASANYSAPVQLGSVMRALATGHVVESRHPDYAPGDAVTGWFGWQDYARVPASAVVRKVLETDLPLSLSLGVLGINGVTAYLALTELGLPKAGETVLVSTAAGSVGSAVGQIAKVHGCRTVGIAGGPVKAQLCRDAFGYDAALDYKAAGWAAQLDEACPNGVDVYFDNTAGAISDAAYPRLAVGGRVVVCGTASIQSWDPVPTGPRVERVLLMKRARMAGFVMFDWMHRYEETVGTLAGLVRDGRLAYREDVLEGIEACPDALAGLYRGENLGKRLIRLV